MRFELTSLKVVMAVIDPMPKAEEREASRLALQHRHGRETGSAPARLLGTVGTEQLIQEGWAVPEEGASSSVPQSLNRVMRTVPFPKVQKHEFP